MFGMSTQLSLMVIDRTYDKRMETMRDSGLNKREIDYFQENIAKVNSVDDLMGDYKLYSFVMKTFGLEDKIPHKALIKEIFESNPNDPKSLVNRLVDGRISEMVKTMGFKMNGTVNLNTISSQWRDEMVDRFLQTKFETEQGMQNPAVENALRFERKASSLTSWYHVLADKQLSEVMRTALGIPAATAGLDVEKQVAALEKKFDIEKLQDPEEVDKLITKYAALSDAQNASSGMMGGGMMGGGFTGSSPALSLISGITSGGMASNILSMPQISGGISRYLIR